ncbi:uncharacterized protein LOC141590194 [Silene latifolia]|uniref:uncharacterized protein LOC141590194 n=1 Tax=Silene latifolia TaxID=37657 RepID=UPI003D785CBB
MICKPIFEKLKVVEHEMWDDECQAAFDRIKEVLSAPPVLSPPIAGLPLSLYLTVTDTAMGAIVSIYTRMDPIKYLFEKPVLNGRMSRWTLMLAEFNLKYVPLKAVKGRVVSDFLADNPTEEDSVTDMWSFPDENVVHVEDEVWDIYFDGASSSMGYGVGILLISPKGEHLDFLATNNAAEYEAYLLGLRSAISLNIKRLLVHGDSSLVINQVTGSWNIKSNSLAPYQAKIEELEKYFEEIHYVHLPREENQFTDALSKLAAMVNIPDHIDSMPLYVERRSAPSYINEINGTEEDEIEPWYTSILKFKDTGEYPENLDARGKRVLRMLSTQFVEANGGQLYERPRKVSYCNVLVKRQPTKSWRRFMTGNVDPT